MLKIPEVFGVAEARKEFGHVLDEVDKGGTVIIKGAKGREALVINADAFRRLQEAYAEAVGELETRRILEDERAMQALNEVEGSSGGEGQAYSLAEVEDMIERGDDHGGRASSRRGSRSRLVFHRAGVESLMELPAKIQKQVLRKTQTIEEAPASAGYPLRKPLQGYRGIHSGRYRIIWRLATVEGEEVAEVVYVGIRSEGDERDAYEELSRMFELPV